MRWDRDGIWKSARTAIALPRPARTCSRTSCSFRRIDVDARNRPVAGWRNDRIRCWRGSAISLAAFWGALSYLYAFTRSALGDEKATWALWLLAAYPFALFFGALYTESLFLLGVVGSFYHFTRQQFGRAAFWGLVVGLTRLNGSLLSIPLTILAISAWCRRFLCDGPAMAQPSGIRPCSNDARLREARRSRRRRCPLSDC